MPDEQLERSDRRNSGIAVVGPLRAHRDVAGKQCRIDFGQRQLTKSWYRSRNCYSVAGRSVRVTASPCAGSHGHSWKVLCAMPYGLSLQADPVPLSIRGAFDSFYRETGSGWQFSMRRRHVATVMPTAQTPTAPLAATGGPVPHGAYRTHTDRWSGPRPENDPQPVLNAGDRQTPAAADIERIAEW
jgi:hypothetical protein